MSIMIAETALQRIFRNILQQGCIPNHVGIVLDGNRRYARKRNLETIEGHKKGCLIFDSVIDWSILCGVRELTVYIFSIKNFDRSPEEVAGILGVIKDDIKRRLANLEDTVIGLARYQYIGDWSLLPEDMKPLIAKLMEKTINNTEITVNFAFAYTGRNEITFGVNTLIKGLANHSLELHNVNEDVLNQSLQLYPLSPVDLIIRTGECRLSEFLSWSIDQNSVICFRDQYWPTFSYWNFLACILHYQTSGFQLSSIFGRKPENDQRPNDFLDEYKNKMWSKIEKSIREEQHFEAQ